MPAQRSGSSNLPALRVATTDDHELKEELAWATFRERFAAEGLLARARDSYRREDWDDAQAATLEILHRHASAPEAGHALWILGVSSAALHEHDHAERALLALLCTEVAPDPVLSGPLSTSALDGARCTAAPEANEDPADAWLLLARVEQALGHIHSALAAYQQVIRIAPIGASARTKARLGRVSVASLTYDVDLAFREAVAIIDEDSDQSAAQIALLIAAGGIVNEDWNRDGRKDTQSGVSRRVVARWLATNPPGAVPVLSRALHDLLQQQRCGAARRVRARLSRLPEGRVMAQGFDDRMRACVGR